jgi:DNA-binding transcriptional regulator GbsR (MarR family)
MTLSQNATRFILHWGEMGSRWGVNRTVAQVHALLYLAPQPIHAEEISDTLVLARSNVSVALKELQQWGLVRLTHVLGDRRDHFEAEQDVWEMFRILIIERRKRELEPTMSFLRDSVLQASEPRSTSVDLVDKAEVKKMQSILEFLEILTDCAHEMQKISPPNLRKMMRSGPKLGSKLQALL